jgi:hypothetical protein
MFITVDYKETRLYKTNLHLEKHQDQTYMQGVSPIIAQFFT